jgi:hypothetical protein
MDHPIDLHLTAAFKILKYIKGTLRKGLLFPSSSNMDIVTYYDLTGHLILTPGISFLDFKSFLVHLWSLRNPRSNQ